MNEIVFEDQILLEKDTEHLKERQLDIYKNQRGLKNNIYHGEWRKILDYFDFENLYTTKIDGTRILIFKYKGIPVFVDLNRDNESVLIDWNDKLDQFEQVLISSYEISNHFNLTGCIFYLNLYQGGVFSSQGDFDLSFSLLSSEDDLEKQVLEMKEKYPDITCKEQQLRSGNYFYVYLLNKNQYSIRSYETFPNRMNIPKRIYKPRINIIDKTSQMREIISSWRTDGVDFTFKDFFNLKIWNHHDDGLNGLIIQKLSGYIWRLLVDQFDFQEYKSFFVGSKEYLILNESSKEMILFDGNRFSRKIHEQMNPRRGPNHKIGYYRRKGLKKYVVKIKEMCKEFKTTQKVLSDPLILVLNHSGLHQYRNSTWKPRIVEYMKSLN